MGQSENPASSSIIIAIINESAMSISCTLMAYNEANATKGSSMVLSDFVTSKHIGVKIPHHRHHSP